MATQQQYEAALLRFEMGRATKQDLELLKKAAQQAGSFGNRVRAAIDKA